MYKSSLNKKEDLLAEKRQNAWRKLNQDLPLSDSDDEKGLLRLSRDHSDGLRTFRLSITACLNVADYSVCGLEITQGQFETFHVEDNLFEPLRPAKNFKSAWIRYGEEDADTVNVCILCKAILRKKKRNGPKFSRANIPTAPSCVEVSELTIIEQMLIGPVLPMVYTLRYRGFGQYQSKGQCVAFYNKVQEVTKVLPRKLSDVVINVKDAYGSGCIAINVGRVRRALHFLKRNHPDFHSIRICEENFSEPQAVSFQTVQKQNLAKRQIIENIDAFDVIHDKGQIQIVEKEIAERALCNTIAVETKNLRDDVRKSVYQAFQSLLRKQTTIYNGKNSREGWHLMYPCLLWNGKGGPERGLRPT